MPRMDKEEARLSPETEERFVLLRQLVVTGEAALVPDSGGKLRIIYASERKGLQHASHGLMEQKVEPAECRDTPKAGQSGVVPRASHRHRHSSSSVPEVELPSPESYCKCKRAVKETAQAIDIAVTSQEKLDMKKDPGPEDSLHKGGQEEIARTRPGPGEVKREESEPEN